VQRVSGDRQTGRKAARDLAALHPQHFAKAVVLHAAFAKDISLKTMLFKLGPWKLDLHTFSKIRDMGGKFILKSQPGHGTQAIVCLPLRRVAA